MIISEETVIKYKFKCKSCGKTKVSVHKPRAEKGICTTCERKVVENPNQSKMF